MYVCLGHGWALTMVLHDYSSPEAVPYLSCSSHGFGGVRQSGPPRGSSGLAIAAPLRDDGLPLVLSVVVCMFVWVMGGL